MIATPVAGEVGKEGDTVSLTCSAQGYPTPQFTWKPSGKEVRGRNVKKKKNPPPSFSPLKCPSLKHRKGSVSEKSSPTAYSVSIWVETWILKINLFFMIFFRSLSWKTAISNFKAYGEKEKEAGRVKEQRFREGYFICIDLDVEVIEMKETCSKK